MVRISGQGLYSPAWTDPSGFSSGTRSPGKSALSRMLSRTSPRIVKVGDTMKSMKPRKENFTFWVSECDEQLDFDATDEFMGMSEIKCAALSLIKLLLLIKCFLKTFHQHWSF